MKLFSLKTLSTALVLALSANVAHAAVKVGVIDLQKALQEVKRGATAKSTLEKEFDAKKKQIEKEQTSIKKMSEDFQKKSMVMSEKARQEKGMEVQQKMQGFQELVQKSQMEIQQREGELTAPIIKDLREMVPELAKSKGLEMVFETNSVGGPSQALGSNLVYAQDKADLTPDLIAAFDKKFK